MTSTKRFSWGNSIYQEHDFANDKRLSYGIFIGGDLDHNKFDIKPIRTIYKLASANLAKMAVYST